MLEAEIGSGCDFHPHEKQQLCLGQKMARARYSLSKGISPSKIPSAQSAYMLCWVGRWVGAHEINNVWQDRNQFGEFAEWARRYILRSTYNKRAHADTK
jgi:hypothetical protein